MEKAGVTYCVAVDGSEASEMAFQTVVKDMFSQETDQLVVAHISDKRKDYLPWNMKSNFVADVYEAKILELGHAARYCWREVDTKKTSKECLWELAQQEKAEIIVCGNHGRKGPKCDETVLGSAIQHLSLNNQFPCIIIKDRKARAQKPDGCLRYGVCFDGSPKAIKVLDLVLRIMRKTDKLMTITVAEEGVKTQAQVSSFVTEKCSKAGVSRFEVVVLPTIEHHNTFEIIKKFLVEQAQDIERHGYIDFVAVGNQGMNFASKNDELYLGSVANAVLRCKLMNVIFVA